MPATADHSLRTPEAKRAYNRSLFSVVATRYRVATRVLSLWRDAFWKRTMVRMGPAHLTGTIVDLASGTGDIALLCAVRYPQATILATDLSPDMLQRGPHTIRITPIIADMCHTPVRPGSAELVTGSYALRNAPSLEGVLRETARVLSAEGVALFLDFSKPASRVLQKAEWLLLWIWGEFWSLLLHQQRGVYSYIADSLALYPDRVALRHQCARNGLTVTRSRLFFFGIIEVLECRPAPAPAAPNDTAAHGAVSTSGPRP